MQLPKIDSDLPSSTLLGAEIDWNPDVLRASAWLQHVPFAFWLVKAIRPRCLVELGTHTGVSYFAFCQAVQRLGLSTRCFAVDTWKGDPHAGEYGEEVFADVTTVNDQRFRAFSSLLRTTFDDAHGYFADGEVDLLHIDGLHTYEAVAHDFERWKPKLSARGVVVFHDINVRERGFGVWRLWHELSGQYAHFRFDHGYGLGILGVGSALPDDVLRLLSLPDSGESADHTRSAMAARGEAVLRLYQLNEMATRAYAAEELQAASAARLEAVQQSAADATAREKLALEGQYALVEQHGVLKRLMAEHRDRAEAVRADAATRAESARADAAAKHALAESRWSGLHMAQEQAITARDDRITLLTGHADALQRLLAERQDSIERIGNALHRRERRTFSFRWRRLLRSIQKRLPEGWMAETPAPPTLPAPALPPTLPVFEPLAPPVAATAGAAKSGPLAIVWIGGEPDTPGYRYRVLYWADAARAAGARVVHLRIDEVEAHSHEIAAASIVVLWRAAWDEHVSRIVDDVREAGAKLVFDIDDLMIDPSLATVETIDGIRSQSLAESAVAEFYGRVRRTAEAADFGMATTEELAAHFRLMQKPAFVMPNGFDSTVLRVSRLAARRRRVSPDDGFVRIGYAGGSRTHQRDFALCSEALARLLEQKPQALLVLFQDAYGTPLVDIGEYPELARCADRIEWRQLVPLVELPNELARFDINLAPLEVGNVFCEAKSELKYFEAALVGVCTVASPTGPYRRAIVNGLNGSLAAGPADWFAALSRLVDSVAERQRLAGRALLDVLWTFGSERRAALVDSMTQQVLGGLSGARAFALQVAQAGQPRRTPQVPAHDVVFEHDALRPSSVTVVIPLYNYGGYVVEALDSVAGQTLADIDLVVVDDASTDDSLAVATGWCRANHQRFNRVLVVRNSFNSKLGPSRNVGFACAETPYVLPLDADNRLLPNCAEVCLREIERSGAAYVYPRIRAFGGADYMMGELPYSALRFVGGNYIDAMALVSRSVWAGVGGYANVPFGWEDYAFWCAIAELGLAGVPVGKEPLAEYRVHRSSMLSLHTNVPENHRVMVSYLHQRYPWLAVAWNYGDAGLNEPALGATPIRGRDERLLEILRCPETGQPLEREGMEGLRTKDGQRRWPLVAGRPMLFPNLGAVEQRPVDHISNRPPPEVVERMRAAKDWVLHVSAGGTPDQIDHVVEAEVAVFRHTDVIADAHCLPFMDACFEGIVSLNAFEHYHDPQRAAAEFLRVLKPGGWLFVRTAFLQPLHESP